MKRIGVDVGGTHTDLVLIDEATGEIAVHKVPTSVDDPSAGAVDAVGELCATAGIGLAELDYFIHGTTIATNIALEHNGARAGLITTDGFRDVLHIARHKRPLTFSLQLDLPWQSYPLVQRRHRLTVPERIVAPSGEIRVPLDEDAVRAAVRQLVAEGVEAIAVCFLTSYLNPAHEFRAGEIVAEEAPGIFISLSHQIVQQYREYERFSTTALNAFVGPKTARYLGRLADTLTERGLKADLHLMQSSGGCATVEAASRHPVTLLMSGPAGGLLGGIWAGRSAGYDSVITLDVGGTSADIGVAPGGELRFKHLLDTKIGAYHAMVPMAEVDAIGAGGGSIAYVDPGGLFQVGPRSAGADPGPCCYDRGGVEPTATDCLVALGRIAPDSFLGGRLPLNKALAVNAIEDHLCRPLGMGLAEAALGALKILNHNMIQAIEENSVRRGYDPRDFALVAFGGAGPLFACDIARELSIPTVIIPLIPGLTSALGLMTGDIAYDHSQTQMVMLDDVDVGALEKAYRDLEGRARAQLEADGFAPDDMVFLRLADCRYGGQGYELRCEAPGDATDPGFRDALAAFFNAAHEREYGQAFPERPVQLVNIRVTGIGRVPPVPPREIAAGGGEPAAPIGRDDIVFAVDGAPQPFTTPRFDRADLLAGNRIAGPAIIQQMDTTTVIPPDFTASVDRHGNLIITSA